MEQEFLAMHTLTRLGLHSQMPTFLKFLLCVIGLSVSSLSLADVNLSVAPVCPTQGTAVTLTAVQGSNSPSLISLLSQTLENSRFFKVVVRGSNTSIGGAPPSTLTTMLGILSPGSYHVDFYIRIATEINGNEQLGPEMLAGYTDFRVESSAMLCAAWGIALTQGAVQATTTKYTVQQSDSGARYRRRPKPGCRSRSKLSSIESVLGLCECRCDPCRCGLKC